MCTKTWAHFWRYHITWARQRDYLNLLIQIKYSICATKVYSDILAFCHSIFVPIYQNFKASYFAYAAVLHTCPRSSFCNISISFMLSTFHISLLDLSLCPNRSSSPWTLNLVSMASVIPLSLKSLKHPFKKSAQSQVWWCVPTISGLWKRRQEDQEFLHLHSQTTCLRLSLKTQTVRFIASKTDNSNRASDRSISL